MTATPVAPEQRPPTWQNCQCCNGTGICQCSHTPNVNRIGEFIQAGKPTKLICDKCRMKAGAYK